jgi:hypothetical protein
MIEWGNLTIPWREFAQMRIHKNNGRLLIK